jgi:hypothetical protein
MQLFLPFVQQDHSLHFIESVNDGQWTSPQSVPGQSTGQKPAMTFWSGYWDFAMAYVADKPSNDLLVSGYSPSTGWTPSIKSRGSPAVPAPR